MYKIFTISILAIFKAFEMKITFPDSVRINTQQSGACTVRASPMVLPENLHLFTNDGCEITKSIVSNNSTDTTAIHFWMNVNSSCQHISCFTTFEKEMKYISSKCCMALYLYSYGFSDKSFSSYMFVWINTYQRMYWYT